MKVAIIKSNYTPYGGGEKYATRLIQAFAERDSSVDVLTAESGGWGDDIYNVKCVTLRQYRHNNLVRLLTFNASVNSYLSSSGYDCIFSMDRTDFQTHLRAGGGSHAAWIQRRCEEYSYLRCLSFRINPFHRAMIRMERRAFLSDQLKRIFCNSNLVREDIIHYYPRAEDKIMVVHNGVEWNELSGAFDEAAHRREEIMKHLGLHREKYHFLFVGSGYERKGLSKAIHALKRLPGHVDLVVVGKDKNEKRYRSHAGKLKIGHRVHFFGPRRDVTPFLQVADAFILPTIYDPFSNASLEALAMGLYTVTSGANGCAEVIQSGAGCVIEDLRSIDSVTDAMKTALGTHSTKEEIRDSVRHLDFIGQLHKIVDMCVSDSGK
jgi:UDP-glucose:(heptosyl)LPS alpha-1,3-glucosyltransferase